MIDSKRANQRSIPWFAPGALALLAGASLLIARPDIARRVLSSDEFMPHGHCYMWRPELVWLHAVSDASIALAYLSIPVALTVLVRRRKDLPFKPLFILFGGFVLACGLTHLMDVWTIWTPTYWLAGGLKAITALVSIASAFTLVRSLPRVLALPDQWKALTALNAQLQTSEERFRNVIEGASVGMVVVNDKGAIVLVNRALESMFGYHRSEVLGRPVEMLIPERLRSNHPAHRAGFSLDPRPRAMGAERELSGLRKNGLEIPIELGLTPLLDGSAAQVLGSVVDISARRLAEIERRETIDALQSFRLMVESVKDYAIFQLDAEGCIQTWNSGASAIKGYAAEEVIGKHISMFYPPENAGHTVEELEIAAKTGHYEEDGWRVRKDGSRFWANVVISAVPGTTRGSVRAFVKVTRDLTERKQTADALAHALRERTALLQEVHHRVKNNLQMIASLLSLQARQITDKQARVVIFETRDRVRSIALLHESLYQSADLGRVDMREYVSKLVHALRQTVPADGSLPSIDQRVERILFPVDAAVPCGLIIHELIVNALKHAFAGSASGSDEIVVSLSETEESCTLVVRDNGRGFAATHDPADERKLGLTLVNDLTLQLDGSVSFQTADGALCKIVFPKPRRPASAFPPAPGV